MALEVLGKVTLDTSQPDAALQHVGDKAKLIDETKHPIAVDTHEAESKLEGLKEKAKDALSGIGAGFAAGGAVIGIEKGIDAYKELLKSQSDLKIAVAGTNKSQEEQKQIFEQSKEEIDQLSAKYHLHEEAVAGVETAIIGVGGVTGAAKSKLTEIGLAFGQLNIPAKALKGIIAGAADPESLQAFEQLKSKIGDLGPEFAAAQTPAEKTDALYKRLSGTLSGMSNLDPELAAMQDMEIGTKKLEQSGGQLIISFLAPVIPILTGLAHIVTGVVNPAVGEASKFIQDNKVAVGILAVGLGVMAVAMNAAAIGTTALSVGQKVAAITTNAVAVAQRLWNAAMMANPIGLIIGGITVLVGVAVLLYNKVDFVKKGIDALWGAIKTAIPFIGGIADMLGLSSKKADDSTDSLDKNAKASKEVASAQDEMRAAVESANAAFKQQQDDSKGTVDLNRQQFERQAQYIKSGYAEVNGQLVKLTAEQIAGYKKSNEELVAQAKDRQAQLNAIAKSGSAFDKSIGLSKETNQNKDLLGLAKERADTAAKILESELKLDRLSKGQQFTDADSLTVEQKRNEVFSQQVEQLKLMTAEKAKFAGKTTLEVQGGQIKELDLKAKITLDAKKTEEDFNKATIALTKKQIEVGILPKSDGIKIVNAQIDELGQKLTVLRATALINPGDKKTLTEIASLQTQVIDLEKQRADLETSLSDQVSAARIANITDETEKALAERGRQFEKDLQFKKDAINAGRELTAQEIELERQLTIKYEADVAKIRADAQKSELDNERKQREGVVNVFVDSLKSMLQEQQKFDRLAYEDKKLQLDKQRSSVEKDYQKGVISAREYALDLEKIDKERADNEKSQEANKWALLKGIVSNGSNFVQQQMQQMAAAQLQALAASAAGDKVAATAHREEANATLMGAIAKAIFGQTALDPIAGPFIGMGIGLAMEAAFAGIEKLLGFATGGIAMVGEKGPEIIGPAKDFSQMITMLVSTTASEMRRALAVDRGPVRGGGGRLDVRISGTSRASGRSLDTVLRQESIGARNERLLPA